MSPPLDPFGSGCPPFATPAAARRASATKERRKQAPEESCLGSSAASRPDDAKSTSRWTKAEAAARAALGAAESEVASTSARAAEALTALKTLEDGAGDALRARGAADAALANREAVLVTARAALEAVGREIKATRARAGEASAAAASASADVVKGRAGVLAWTARVEKCAGDYADAFAEAAADAEVGLREVGTIFGEDITTSGEDVTDRVLFEGKAVHPVAVASLAPELPTLILLSIQDLRAPAMERGHLEACVARLEADRKEAAAKGNVGAIREYRAAEKKYLLAVGELTSISTARDAARSEFETLRRARLDMFMTGFSIITLRLKEMYQMITLGGDAELELVDSLDPFAEGIVFSVRPPKKSWKNIANLSGGEKTLSSLALVFALHHYRPTPL